METKTTFSELAAEVAYIRSAHQEQKAEWDALLAAFEEANRNVKDSLAATKDALADAERRLREAALAQYEATGTKKLSHGVGVKVTTKLDYDPAAALEWAKTHGLALKLDAKAFEKIAKADTPNFVQVLEVPTVTLPTDTAKLLAD